MVTKTATKPATKTVAKVAPTKTTKTPKVPKAMQAITTIRENRGRDHSPKWDGTDALTPEQYTRHFHSAMAWYRLESSSKDLKPKVIDWMGRNGYTKTKIAAYKKTKDWRTDITMGAIAASLIKGMPDKRKGFNNDRSTVEWLKANIEQVIETGKLDIEVIAASKADKAVVPMPNIQDRIRDAAGIMTEEIDAAIDSYITDPKSFDPKAFGIARLLRGKGAKAAHTRFIKAQYEQMLGDYTALVGKNGDEQLIEGYSNYTKKEIKGMFDFLTSIVDACNLIAAEAKVLKKTRAKKIKPAEEQVAKIKFKATDPKLGVASIPPAQLIGAQIAVVYNSKTRKIGIYNAKSSEGLGVKGAGLINFTEKSTQKTLRKPELQLKEFKEMNTGRRAQTWFDAIKATDILLNGRLNADIMILKVWK